MMADLQSAALATWLRGQKFRKGESMARVGTTTN